MPATTRDHIEGAWTRRPIPIQSGDRASTIEPRTRRPTSVRLGVRRSRPLRSLRCRTSDAQPDRVEGPGAPRPAVSRTTPGGLRVRPRQTSAPSSRSTDSRDARTPLVNRSPDGRASAPARRRCVDARSSPIAARTRPRSTAGGRADRRLNPRRRSDVAGGAHVEPLASAGGTRPSPHSQ